MLDNGKTMFTKQQVLDILKEIDEDETNTIDFFECLQVCDFLCVIFATIYTHIRAVGSEGGGGGGGGGGGDHFLA
jgi:hypothetical protein